MPLKKPLFCLGLGLALAASSQLMASSFRLWNNQIQDMPTSTQTLEELALTPLVGFEISGTTRRMSFMVLDHGCTELEHFILHVDKESEPARLGLERTVLDNCETSPVIGFVSVDFDQIGLSQNAPVEMLNPIILQELSMPIVREPQPVLELF